MSDWAGEPLPGMRWSPAQHYDQGFQAWKQAQTLQDPTDSLLDVIGQALMGLLRERMERS